MDISEQGIALIKSFESCRLTAYKALSSEEYYTIGWGHYGADVKAGQTISQAEADALFLTDLKKFVRYTKTYTSSMELNQNQFDALVSFCYNCGPGTLKKLVSGRTAEEIAEHITDYTKSNGQVIKGLVRRRQEEKELYCKGKETAAMTVKIGSARIDENGRASGGKNGDQTGKEVCTQDFYMHSKGWYILRPKNAGDAGKLASAMQAACDNDNIGYDQNSRTDIISKLAKYGSMAKIAEKTEADCGTLVRGCCIEAGFDPGNFTTANEAAVLLKTGKFENKIAVTSSAQLCCGDVLVTKTKGHTVIVVDGNTRKAQATPNSTPAAVKKFAVVKGSPQQFSDIIKNIKSALNADYRLSFVINDTVDAILLVNLGNVELSQQSYKSSITFALTQLLAWWGYNITPGNTYTGTVTNTIRTFQTQTGLKVTGTTTLETWTKLLGR